MSLIFQYLAKEIIIKTKHRPEINILCSCPIITQKRFNHILSTDKSNILFMR
jgi:hypothetical protein